MAARIAGMADWDERFERGEYPEAPAPSNMLRQYVESSAIPTGRALDGSRVGLEIIRERAEARGVADRLELVEADIPTYGFPTDTDDLVTISF